MSERMNIGEFSKLCRTTVKTLRHYEKEGILRPERVDAWTGYRQYGVGQLPRMDWIQQLRGMGFGVGEIRELFESGSPTPSAEVLERKIAECESELKRLRKRRKQLEAMVAERNKQKGTKMNEIRIEKLPGCIVASHREVVKSYADLGRMCCETIAPEMARLGCECPEPGYCFTFEHGEEYREHDIDIEYCERVTKRGTDSEIIQFKEVAEVPEAACLYYRGPYEGLASGYRELFAHLEREGWKRTGAPRACYVDGPWNQEDPKQWLTIIQVPVERG